MPNAPAHIDDVLRGKPYNPPKTIDEALGLGNGPPPKNVDEALAVKAASDAARKRLEAAQAALLNSAPDENAVEYARPEEKNHA